MNTLLLYMMEQQKLQADTDQRGEEEWRAAERSEADRLVLDTRHLELEKEVAAQREAERFKKEAERLAFEERRLQADVELQRQREAMYLQEKQERKRLAICNQLKQWDNSTDVEAYINKFEVATSTQ